MFLAGYDQTSCKVRDFAPTEHVTPHIFTRQSQVRVHSWRSSQHRSLDSVRYKLDDQRQSRHLDTETIRLDLWQTTLEASGNRLMRVITAILQINALS